MRKVRSIGSTVGVSKPASWSSSATAPGALSENGPGASGSAGGARPTSRAAAGNADSHGLASGTSQTAMTSLPPGRRTRRASRSACSGSTHEHVAEAAEDAVDRGELRVDPLEVDRLELDVVDAELRGAAAGGLDHRLGAVGADQLAAGMQQLGGEEADVAAAGGELEDRLAGLGLEAVDHPVRDGQRAVVEGVGAGLPARRDALPALAAGCSLCFRIHARQPTVRARAGARGGRACRRRCGAAAR